MDDALTPFERAERVRRNDAERGRRKFWAERRAAVGYAPSRRALVDRWALEADVEHIIEATKAGSNTFQMPTYFNRRGLRHDIDWLGHKMRVLYEFDDDAKWRRRAKLMEQIELRSRQLLALLDTVDDEDQNDIEWCKSRLDSERSGLIATDIRGGSLRDDDAEEGGGVERLLIDLRRIKAASTASLKREDLKGKAPYPQSQTILEAMVRVHLPRIFERRFHNPATSGKHGEALRSEDSPFLRFTSAVFAELGIVSQRGPYQLSSIARAMRN